MTVKIIHIVVNNYVATT